MDEAVKFEFQMLFGNRGVFANPAYSLYLIAALIITFITLFKLPSRIYMAQKQVLFAKLGSCS